MCVYGVVYADLKGTAAVAAAAAASMVQLGLCKRHFFPLLHLKLVIFIGHIDGPTEFITLSFIVDLFNWNTMLFAPVDMYMHARADWKT